MLAGLNTPPEVHSIANKNADYFFKWKTSYKEEREVKKQINANNAGQEYLKAAFKQGDTRRCSPGSKIKD